MLQCYGKGFRLDSLDIRPELNANNGLLSGQMAANINNGQPAKWNVLFVGAALNLVYTLQIGAFFNITRGSISVQSGRTNDCDAYAIIIEGITEAINDNAPNYGRLYLMVADNIRIVSKVGADANNAMRIILGSYDSVVPPVAADGYTQWFSLFVNAASGAAARLNADDFIEIRAAELIQAYNKKITAFLCF